MAKRRSCRRTNEQDAFHDRAVKIRKMTDEQICNHIDEIENEAYEKGYQEGIGKSKNSDTGKEMNHVKEFIDLIAGGNIKGIGCATISKLMRLATENGYIN